MIKINVIFVHGIELSTFTEKLREIGAGSRFALSVVKKITAIDKCIKKLVLYFVLIIAIYKRISSTQYVTIFDSL